MSNTNLPLTVQATQTIAATTTSGNVALGTPNVSGGSIQIVNTGSVPVFVAVGVDNTVTAVNTFPSNNMPVPATSTLIYTVRQDFAYVACITASATATVYISRGEGY